VSSHLRLGLPSRLFPSHFGTRNLYTILFLSMRGTCPGHLIPLDLITVIHLAKSTRYESSGNTKRQKFTKTEHICLDNISSNVVLSWCGSCFCVKASCRCRLYFRRFRDLYCLHFQVEMAIQRNLEMFTADRLHEREIHLIERRMKSMQSVQTHSCKGLNHTAAV
jgi:hypothetical protein